MYQTALENIENGNSADGGKTRPARNQPSQGESNFGDSSGPLFSIYSKASEEEDNEMVKCWKKDLVGILYFAGLFSAAVAIFLAVTIQDLMPNSQDTSAFYLGQILEILANPNVTRTSVPSPARPPPFSRPRYVVWVNSLWFLSFVVSLSCALWAILLQQWARRYIRLARPARGSPEKRARIRALFAYGVDKMHIPWAVEGLPMLLHLSVLLFFCGLVIFLFNLDREVFTSVVWWICPFTLVYGLITALPLIRHDSPYSAPLSPPAWFLYSSFLHATFTVLSFITDRYSSYETWKYYSDLKDRYRGWMLGGVEKAAEEMASERSTEIDVQILGWTINDALGDDDSLEKIFEAIPGFFNSNLVKDLERDFPLSQLETLWGALDGFMGRTLSSNSVTESVKSRRDVLCRDIMSMIPCPRYYMGDNLRSYYYQAPVSIERLQAMGRWITHSSHDVSVTARHRVIENLPRIRERDNRWIALASDVYGLPARDIEHNVAMGGDSVFLAILIHLSRRAIHFHREGLCRFVGALTQFDIRHTLPGLQHDFCTFWNELVQEAKNRGYGSNPVYILHLIRRLYITLHQGTDATPTAFSASTDTFDAILFQPSSYPLCDIASHRPGSIVHVPLLIQPDSPNTSSHHSTSGGNTAAQKVKEGSNIAGPSPSPTPSEIGKGSQAPAATSPALPALTNSRPTYASPGAVATALQGIPPAATLSRPLEGTARQDMVAPCPEFGISEILSTVSTPAPAPTLAPVLASTPPVLNASLTSCDSGATSASDPLIPVSSVVGFSVPTSPPPSCVPPFPRTPSCQTGNTTPPRLRARGLVNSGNTCFANAVLHLLVNSPPFWDLLRELGDLKGKRGGGPETGSGATPLVDATVRFFEEFMFKDEELPTTQQSLQLTARGKQREDEEEKKENKVVDSFEPTYMYDAMKEKRQLNILLDGKHDDAEEFLGLYLDALDEELIELRTYIGTHKPPSASGVEGLDEEVQSTQGQTAVGKRDHTANSAESPISRIFGGRSRSFVRAPSQSDTVTIEAWRSLKLFIQPDSIHNIQDALAHISRPQPVQVSQSGSSEANQQVLLEALPPVLVLHLERFLYDAATDCIDKISKPVQFMPELEIPPEIIAPVPGKSAEPVQYKLYGVLYHHGESAGSGNYTVDVLHPNGDSGSGEAWLHIDDEVVSAVSHEDVFRGHDNEWMDNQCAYMLFYCRTTQTC